MSRVPFDNNADCFESSFHKLFRPVFLMPGGSRSVNRKIPRQRSEADQRRKEIFDLSRQTADGKNRRVAV